MKIRHNSLLQSAVAAVALLGINEARAADATWITPGGSANWVDGANWSPATAPGGVGTTTNQDTATFSTTLTSNLTVSVDANRNIKNLVVSDTSAFELDFSANPWRLSDGGLIHNTSTSGARNVEFSNGIVVQGQSAAATITSDASSASGRFRFLGGFTGQSTGGNVTTLTLNGSNTASNTMSGVNSTNFAIVKEGTGTWFMSGTSAYARGTTLNAGKLQYNQTASFGTGTLTINGGTTIEKVFDTASKTIANAISVGGDFPLANTSSTTTETFSGAVDLGGATRTITNASKTFVFSGAISNGGLTKAGAGNLTLSGVNAYTGDTTVSAGTLVLADDSQSAFAIGADGVNNQFNGTGTLTLDGDFSFNLIGAGTGLGDTWNIVDVGTLAATFGATFSVVGFNDIGGNVWEKVNGPTTYQFDEATGNLEVTAIPEPATWALLAGSLTVLMVTRRRRMA